MVATTQDYRPPVLYKNTDHSYYKTTHCGIYTTCKLQTKLCTHTLRISYIGYAVYNKLCALFYTHL